MKKHYIGAVYDVTAKNMNHLIAQLEAANKEIQESKGPTVTFQFPNDSEHQYEIKCHMKATEMQSVISEVINQIRGRIKYKEIESPEEEFLNEIRQSLFGVYIDE